MAFATFAGNGLNPWIQILAASQQKLIRQSLNLAPNPTRYSHAAAAR